MNYYNPYLYTLPTQALNTPKVGLISRLLGGRNLTFSSFLSGTQKTLNVINQTIPLVKQVHPMVKNAKTMFKVMNEFKKSGITPKTKPKANNITYQTNTNKQINNQGPTFFQ